MTTKIHTARVESTGRVNAPAKRVYSLIADYRGGHQRIIPPRFFRNLVAESGGYGEGSVIAYDFIMAGSTRRARARVAEPDPGRVLTETDLAMGALTTFVVEPVTDTSCDVTISTLIPIHGGMLGWIERRVIGRLLRKVYAEELALIDSAARSADMTPRSVDASAGSAAS